MQDWNPNEQTDLIASLALTQTISLVRKNVVKEYWTTSELTETPIFSKVMSRNRFEDIDRCLHFNDNQDTTTIENRFW